MQKSNEEKTVICSALIAVTNIKIRLLFVAPIMASSGQNQSTRRRVAGSIFIPAIHKAMQQQQFVLRGYHQRH